MTIAGLGKIHAEMEMDVELKRRVEEAMERTHLAQIDYAVLEFDSDSFNQSKGTIAGRSRVNDGEPQWPGEVGARLWIAHCSAPYIYQCPIPARSGNLAIVPSMVETAVGLQLYQEEHGRERKAGSDLWQQWR